MSNRYHINFDRLANMLTPSYLRKRKYIMIMQAILSPLQAMNEEFVEYVTEHKIEAAMTSQVIMLEWYLNHKFSKYLVDQNDHITLDDPVDVGVPIYRKGDPNMQPSTIWYVNVGWPDEVNGTEEEPKPFYYKAENKIINETSFTVTVPPIKIRQEDFVPMVSLVVNMYKIAGKTFRVKITENK